MADEKYMKAISDLSMWEVFFNTLPGGDLIRKGLSDLDSGVRSASALLVLIGGTRMRNLGLPVPQGEGDPEYSLYDLLSLDDPDSAHSRYNALIRTLVSFERAAECAIK